MQQQIGVIGANGFVGTAMMRLFPNAIPFYKNSNQKKIDVCDAVFVCVPTPVLGKGKLDTSIVEDVVKKCNSPIIIIRSTLNPGTSDYLSLKYKKKISVIPEYVGESVAHPLLDEASRPFLVIGGDPIIREKVVELYTTVYNANISIRLVTNLEAEIIKLTENRAIAFKVAQCQELYDVCKAAKIDYYTIRDSVYGDDPRFNLWWTMIYPNKRGFNSKCIPKDIYAWCAWAESVGYKPEITKAILERNEKWINPIVFSSNGGSDYSPPSTSVTIK